MAKILGFTGRIGSGKTAAAEALHRTARVESAHLEFSDPVISIANGWMGRIGLVDIVGSAQTDALQHAIVEAGMFVPRQVIEAMEFEALQEYLRVRHEMTAANRYISPETKGAHRPLLQWLGHEMVAKAGEDFWSRAVESVINTRIHDGAELVTVGGVRYANNAETIHGLHGYVLEVSRPSSDDVNQSHISEVGIERHFVDAVILNDGSITDLESKMGSLWSDVQGETILAQY